MAEYANQKLEPIEPKKLDQLENYLKSSSEALAIQLDRLENIAVRFRGLQPEQAVKNPDESKGVHKIDSLNIVADRISRQLSVLDKVVTEIEKI